MSSKILAVGSQDLSQAEKKNCLYFPPSEDIGKIECSIHSGPHFGRKIILSFSLQISFKIWWDKNSKQTYKTWIFSRKSCTNCTICHNCNFLTIHIIFSTGFQINHWYCNNTKFRWSLNSCFCYTPTSYAAFCSNWNEDVPLKDLLNYLLHRL